MGFSGYKTYGHYILFQFMFKKQLTQEETYEKYEKNLILSILFVFIILGVLFLVFIMPRFRENYNDNYSRKTEKNNSVDYVGKNKNTPEVNYRTGRDFFNRNNYSSALNYFKAAVRAEPNNIDYLTELAITNYHLKNYREAIKTYEKIISLDKDNASIYNNTGNIYWIIKDTERAEYYFRKAIELDPNLIAAYNNLALMLDENNRENEAIEILNRGIAANSDNTELEKTLKIIKS